MTFGRKNKPRPYLEDDIKLKAIFANSNWWDRRVLDLAVMQS